jgi:hypothetical protein
MMSSRRIHITPCEASAHDVKQRQVGHRSFSARSGFHTTSGAMTYCRPRAIPLLLLVACSQQPRLHPRADALARPTLPALMVDLEASNGGGPSPVPPPSAETSPSPVVIGTFSGRSSTVLGRVVGVTRVGGQIGVLDAQTMTLRVFSLDGMPLYDLGAKGQGPGEFMSPRAVHGLGEGAFVVFDAAGRVTRFDAKPGAPPRTLLRFDGLLESGCVLGDDIYVHGLRPGDDRVVHRYDSVGHYLGSFGEMYRTENRVVLMHVTLGRIACMPAQGLVVVLPALLPELRAYTAEGTLFWWILFRGFTPLELEEIEGGATMREPCGGFDTWAGLAPSRSGSELLVQVLHAIRDCKDDSVRSSIVTLAVSAAGPHARWDPRGPDETAAYWDDDYLITTVESPFPQVFLRPRKTS